MFAANNRIDKQTTYDASSNAFLGAIIKAMNERDTDPVDAFKILMEFYVKTSSETYYNVPMHWRMSHVEDAKRCIALYDQFSKSEVMTAIIKYLNNLRNIKPGGSFSLALSTYFAMFPEYLAQCNDALRAATNKLDLWEPAITAWLTNYMQVHRVGGGNHQYELLQKLGTIIPDNIVDTYVDFLLKQLKQAKRHEAMSGLYKGWVYAALGAIAPRLTIAKREIVTKTLVAAFDDHPNDLSLLGLCEALSTTNLSANKHKKIASRLYLYTMEERGELAKMHEDHQSETISLYARKAFTTLKHLEQYLNEDLRNGMVTPILCSDEPIYQLRNSLLTLESWVPALEKLDVMSSLNLHKNFLELAPLFWHWLNQDKNKDTVWATHRSLYASHIRQAKTNLISVFTPDDEAANQVKLLVTEQSANADVRSNIIENICDELSDHNNKGTANSVRRELHQALVNIKPWTSQMERATIANLLLAGCTATTDPDDLRISAGHAALTYVESLSSQERIDIRNHLLSLMDSIHTEQAAAALSSYAKICPDKELPMLMTRLMAKHSNGYAQLLLTELHAAYRGLEKKVENRVRMLV